MKALILAISLLSSNAFAACEEPAIGTKSASSLSPPISVVVIGKGRLPFHSAPDPGCAMPGVFVVPNDQLVAYAQASGWSSVMYSNARTGNTVSGWVRSSRLKTTGALGPSR